MASIENEQDSEMPSESTQSQTPLSSSEHAVLAVFRKYLMSPGKMLCLSNHEMEAFHESLVDLTGKGLLIQESFPGGYSLTEIGFAAMKEDA